MCFIYVGVILFSKSGIALGSCLSFQKAKYLISDLPNFHETLGHIKFG